MKIISLLVSLVLLSGCGANKSSFEVIDQKTAYEMIQNQEVTILDVRTPEEYEEIHIPGSLNIELAVLEDEIEKVVSDKDTTLLVYCRSGNRSNQAAKLLSELGYTNVFDFGGITTWEYEVE